MFEELPMPTATAEPVETARAVIDDLRAAGPLVPHDAKRGTVLPAETRGARPGPPQPSAVEVSGDNIGELFGALAAAQGEFTEIERTLTARIKSKREGGADYAFDYAPLAEVLAAVRPALSKNGLAIMQFPLAQSGTAMMVRTMIGHKSGQWMRNDLVVGCVSLAPQDIGSAITYARRYSLMAILGIAPDYDDDGAVASGRDQRTYPKGGESREPQKKPGTARVKVASIREMKLPGGKKGWQVKTSAGEALTEDEAMMQACRSAMQTETLIEVVTEARPGADNRKYTWLTEIL